MAAPPLTAAGHDQRWDTRPAHPAPSVNPETWLEETINGALAMRASDMLLQVSPDAQHLECSIRIDSKMRPYRRVDGDAARIIIGRFKSNSDLATSGKYEPEETIHQVTVDGEQRKARVALFRRADGGSAIAMRLPPTGPLRRLNELGFSQENLALFRELLVAANRMVLVAGPMGSGKTTTAHAALLEVADQTRTVWTIEDPVERNIPGLIQLEVDEENGAGFDALLPYLVRSDYDSLFLGEIRDKLTAAAAVRQAKAGRQVLTTIHANDNVTALLRLIELAEDSPLSVLDSVRGVVSQRLVARRNPHWDGRNPFERYYGRVPVHEVLMVTEDLIEAVMAQRPLGVIREIAAKHSLSTFARDARRLLGMNITDHEEIVRALGVQPAELNAAVRRQPAAGGGYPGAPTPGAPGGPGPYRPQLQPGSPAGVPGRGPGEPGGYAGGPGGPLPLPGAGAGAGAGAPAGAVAGGGDRPAAGSAAPGPAVPPAPGAAGAAGAAPAPGAQGAAVPAA